jgi:hypothetical protein
LQQEPQPVSRMSCGFSLNQDPMRHLLPASLSLLLLPAIAGGQIYEHPNFSLNSHPTLEILSVERWEDQMVVNLSLKNERYSGSFCIDSNTVLKNSLGKEEYPRVSMEGIPACPEEYRFISVGEKIRFSLVFEPVPDDVKYIDLLENCRENCVSIKYILLDEDLNSRIYQGVSLYAIGKPAAALRVFEDILDKDYDGISPVFGTVYLYLISIHYEMGNSKEARRVYRELQESGIIGLEEFLETARETGLVR